MATGHSLSWLYFSLRRQTKLWVHTADPTRWLEPTDGVTLEALRRTSSIYLPTGVIPMIPLDLAIKQFSLDDEKHCPALSIGFNIAEDGALQDDYEICLSNIAVKRVRSIL